MDEKIIKNLANRLVNTRNTSNALIAGQRVAVGTVSTDMLNGVTVDPNTDEIWFQVLGGNAYITTDGTTPSATNGVYVLQNTAGCWHKSLAATAKVLGDAAGVVVQITQLSQLFTDSNR